MSEEDPAPKPTRPWREIKADIAQREKPWEGSATSDWVGSRTARTTRTSHHKEKFVIIDPPRRGFLGTRYRSALGEFLARTWPGFTPNLLTLWLNFHINESTIVHVFQETPDMPRLQASPHSASNGVPILQDRSQTIT